MSYIDPSEATLIEGFTVVGLLCVVINILLNYVIINFKKMREDATNKIFLHVNILQALFFLTAPVAFRLGLSYWNVHQTYVCVGLETGITLLFCVACFMFVMICDWYVKIHHEDSYVKFCKVHKFFVLTIYVLLVLFWSLSIPGCFIDRLAVVSMVISYGSAALIGPIALFLIVINIVHLIKKRRIVNNKTNTFGLAIANICLLCWCPLFIFLLVDVNLPMTHTIFFILGNSSPVVNFIYLFVYDEKYNTFLKKVFRCRCEDIEIFDEMSVSYNQADEVEVGEDLIK